MKALFLTRGCLNREANTDILSSAVQALAASGLYTVLLGSDLAEGEEPQAPESALTEHAVETLRAHGGQVHATIHCPHVAGETCYCWGPHPGFLWQAGHDLDLQLDESYVLCDAPEDVSLAHAAGCRPILVLGNRSLDALYDGHQPEPADFPVARHLGQAAEFVATEEALAAELGHPRPPSLLPPFEEGDTLTSFPADVSPKALPTLTVFSTPGGKPLERPAQLIRYGERWLLLFIIGGVWLSLGIAYLLTHLYRMRPFPDFVWYITLQFIPRPVRGALFLLTGILTVLIALRSVRGMLPTAIRWGKDQDR